MAGYGNGNPPKRYEFGRSDSYVAGRANIEARYPRTVQLHLFDLIETQLRCFPPNEHAELIGNTTWSYVSQEGTNVPELDIYFTFEAGKITLREVFADA